MEASLPGCRKRSDSPRPGASQGQCGRAEMKADHKGLPGFCIPVHLRRPHDCRAKRSDSPLDGSKHRRPRISLSCPLCGKIVHCTTAKSVVMIVAASQRQTLAERPMPFAHQRRAITGLLSSEGRVGCSGAGHIRVTCGGSSKPSRRRYW